MSQENAKAFFVKIETDEALAERYKSLLKGMASDRVDEETSMIRATAFAVENGFDITVEDFTLLAESMQDELSTEQLDRVAGGSFRWLFAGTHDDSGKDVNICIIIGFKT